MNAAFADGSVHALDAGMDRFTWWVENEAQTPATLAVLTPAHIRSFLAYTREYRPEGRYGSDHPSANREVRPATVNAYYRIDSPVERASKRLEIRVERVWIEVIEPNTHTGKASRGPPEWRISRPMGWFIDGQIPEMPRLS